MQALSNHLLSLILFTPLTGALLIGLVSNRRVDAIRWLAAGCATVTFLLAVPLWFGYEPPGKTWQFAERGNWIPIAGASYYVGVDGFSILLILLTALITWIAVVASWQEIRTRVKEFYALLLILQTGLLGVFMSLDFLQVFLFWELVLVAMCLLIRMWGEGRPLGSSMKFGIYTLAASLTILVGILFLYFFNHTANGIYAFDITRFHTLQIPIAVQRWVFLAFFLGFGATLALFPLHAWLPDAQTSAPTAASLILAAVVLKMGAYGFVRFSLPILPDASRDFAPAISILGLVALACGAILAWAQRDWMRFVAYSTVCHMAFLTLGLFALTPVGVSGSMLHQINHGLATAGLLLIAGCLRQRSATGGAPIDSYWRAAPLLATISLIMVMSVAGVPALNGFVGEAMVVRGVYAVNKLSATIAVTAMIFVSVSTFWLYRRTMLAPATSATGTTFHDLTAREIGMFAPLVALTFWIGLHPAPFVSRLETSMGRVVARVNPAYAPYLVLGSDCATPAPPDASAPPHGFMLTESCADGSDAKPKPSPADGTRR